MKPDDFGLMMWYDLSPMRPDEFDRTTAYSWHEVMTLRVAFEDGRRKAHDSASAWKQAQTMEPVA
jgi:hypothetical protein